MGDYGYSIDFENEHCSEFLAYYGRLPANASELAKFVLFGYQG